MPTSQRTPLYNEHVRLDARIVDFAGFEMPVHYPGGIPDEHAAVRTGAGLFDIAHMGTAEVSGSGALAFLCTVLTSDVEQLAPGRAQYSCMLRPDGTALDDLYVYCLEEDRYLLVINAANAEADLAWLRSVLDGAAEVDLDAVTVSTDVTLTDLKNAGERSRVGLALQGPSSRKALESVVAPESRAALDTIGFNTIARLRLGEFDVWCSGTGYTGERTAFELFVHPDSLVGLWRVLLEAGAKPCGLGARDSLRIEAGLPLFGHELEGPLGLTMNDIGYGFVIRENDTPFIGQDAYMKRIAANPRRLLRLKGKGRKSLRAGHVMVDDEGRAVGEVTSFAFTDDAFDFVVLAAVERGFKPPAGETAHGVRQSSDKYAPPPDERRQVALEVAKRHPDKRERARWREVY